MTKFIMGLLLGLILGIGGTAAFLISAQGGDYLVVTSPRVRELEASLKQADQERQWLRDQLRTSSDVVTKLESRFVALATRFDDLGSRAATVLGAPPADEPTAPGAAAGFPATTPSRSPSATATPAATPTAGATPAASAPGSPKAKAGERTTGGAPRPS